jgi:hypothetical protein
MHGDHRRRSISSRDEGEVGFGKKIPLTPALSRGEREQILEALCIRPSAWNAGTPDFKKILVRAVRAIRAKAA